MADDAFQMFIDALTQYMGDDGLALAEWALAQRTAAVPDSTILREIRQQEAYKKRFPAMEYFSSIGQAPSESAYIAAEAEYRKAMSVLGPGYEKYVTTDYIGNMMKNDLDTGEVVKRVAAAQDYIYSSAPREVVEALRSEYGMTDNEMVAYMLDPENIGRQVLVDYEIRSARAQVRGAANAVGIESLTAEDADEIAARGYNYTNATPQLARAKEDSRTLAEMASMSGDSFTERESLSAEFNLGGGEAAKRKKKRLASQERARFSGSSGVSRTSLSSGGLGSR